VSTGDDLRDQNGDGTRELARPRAAAGVEAAFLEMRLHDPCKRDPSGRKDVGRNPGRFLSTAMLQRMRERTGTDLKTFGANRETGVETFAPERFTLRAFQA
jgi:hypothetical protein